jgi:hypothetical protein
MQRIEIIRALYGRSVAQLILDGEELQFNFDDRVGLYLPEGLHPVQYLAHGSPGARVAFKAVSAEGAPSSIELELPASGTIAGSGWLEVPETTWPGPRFLPI